MAKHAEVKITLADSDAVLAIIDAAGSLAQKVEWALDDLAYTAPEDAHRRQRDYQVLRDAVEDWREAMKKVRAA